MGIGHLSDGQIQAYFENKKQKNPEILEHIQSCQVCQNNVQIYQKIFHGLN